MKDVAVFKFSIVSVSGCYLTGLRVAGLVWSVPRPERPCYHVSLFAAFSFQDTLTETAPVCQGSYRQGITLPRVLTGLSTF